MANREIFSLAFAFYSFVIRPRKGLHTRYYAVEGMVLYVIAWTHTRTHTHTSFKCVVAHPIILTLRKLR